MDIILFSVCVFIVLVFALALNRKINKTEEKIWSMISKMVQSNGENKRGLDDIEARLGDVIVDVEKLQIESDERTSGYAEMAKAAAAARSDIDKINLQLDKIDFDSVNKALDAQAKFDEGFANILNYMGVEPQKE